jgi:hypothetical protein
MSIVDIVRKYSRNQQEFEKILLYEIEEFKKTDPKFYETASVYQLKVKFEAYLVSKSYVAYAKEMVRKEIRKENPILEDKIEEVEPGHKKKKNKKKK